MDRDRRYFVSSAGTKLPGTDIGRKLYTMVDGEARLLEKFIPIPIVAEEYYATFSQVNRHNRCCQNDLDMEKMFRTKRWALRVNTSLLSMFIVDAWLL